MPIAECQWDTTRAAAIIAQHAALPGAMLPMLHALQREFGYVDPQAIAMIAQALNLSRADVHGVISFYHEFRTEPPGRHLVQVCAAEACQAGGARALLKHAQSRLAIEPGATTTDGQFTLKKVYCLGNCALTPAVSVDGRLYGRVDDARLDAILARCLSA